ncbi:MAG: hydantoinase/oxoprolinase family protein [Alicyclobacillus sp.]|nr:hydantoinase/oxoprolinase family protein [Alicyclobacillus sp.]
MTERFTKYHIGIDIGGTFTDLVLSDHEGNVYRAKSLTTHDRYTDGIVDALEKVARVVGCPVEQILADTELFINGTTIVTNAVAELKGDRVGLLTTKGFRDTLRIARSARTNDYDMQTQVPLPDIVERSRIVEVDERVDYVGKVLVRLNEEQVREAVRYLVEDQGVNALAVCFLWSFKNPAHERRVAEIVEEMYPGMFTTLSSDIFPVAREYERMVTTVLNSFTGQRVRDYVGRLESELRERGLQVPVGLMQSIGGVLSTQEARSRAINLVNSGPVGGVIGANNLGKLLGIRDIITADMGGTSFDTALIKDNEPGLAHRVKLHGFLTGLSMVDITAIGAGGGSICWLDERNAPRVGPRSAGSNPGPACYGLGGEEPTITDVVVALGLIDPELFLAGDMVLDREASVRAIRRRIADPLGWTVTQAAAGLYKIVVNAMSNAVRGVSIERGYDPREFTMIAYGGASPLFIAAIARNMGIRRVVIPANSAVFSAYGLLWSDNLRSHVRTVNWNVTHGSLEEVNRMYRALIDESVEQLRRQGFALKDIEVVKEGDFKFAGQAFELTIPVTSGDLTEADRGRIHDQFVETYERLYGKGTAWEGSEVVMLNCRVTAVGKTVKPKVKMYEADSGRRVSGAAQKQRRVYLPDMDEERDVPAYLDQHIQPGAVIEGPAIVEAGDTTIYVPVHATLMKDPYLNYVLEV